MYSFEDDDGSMKPRLCLLDGQHRYHALKLKAGRVSASCSFNDIAFPLKIIRLSGLAAAKDKIRTYNTRFDFDLIEHQRRQDIFNALQLPANRGRLHWKGGWARVRKNKPYINADNIQDFINHNPGKTLEETFQQLRRANNWMKRHIDDYQVSERTQEALEEYNTYLAVDKACVTMSF